MCRITPMHPQLPAQSRAAMAFAESIQDSEELLQHFDSINSKPPPPNAEVLKRVGLIMAVTAWETYVEDRAAEALAECVHSIDRSPIGALVNKKFKEDIKKLNNPNSTKTCNLFADYLGLDVAAHWAWSNMDVKAVKQRLDDLLAKRGTAVHRSRPTLAEGTNGHLVRREELEKGIRFLKTLVERTELAFKKA